jgi:hypothetical protein
MARGGPPTWRADSERCSCSDGDASLGLPVRRPDSERSSCASTGDGGGGVTRAGGGGIIARPGGGPPLVGTPGSDTGGGLAATLNGTNSVDVGDGKLTGIGSDGFCAPAVELSSGMAW